ncbi:MAG: monovalent cation:proton antiporter-2 (CPA2) family protein [Pseudomonadota bacterium]
MFITPAYAAGAEASTGGMLLAPLVFLAAAVIAVPIFKRLGLGAVLGYLAAGVVIGPSVLGLYADDPEGVMHVAEFGVVLLLFIIGLELNLSRLWSMRRDIFGLGSAQILLTGAVCMLYPLLIAGQPWRASLVAGLGLALSSTAFVMQILEERGEMTAPHGRKAFSILLMQDLAIVPLLALVALLASGGEMGDSSIWWIAAEIVGAVGIVILVGRYLLNPVFRIIARTGAKEIMTALALLIVVAAAWLMTLAGLSMAMGAFLAGVLLAESNYRHELEADLEPFRGLLLGLFFISVGMSVDLGVIAANWLPLLAALIVFVTLKFGVVYGAVRAFGDGHPVAVKTAAFLAQGGEFGFVLFSSAVAVGVMTQEHATLLIALVTLSMALTPAIVAFAPRFLIRRAQQEEREEDFSTADGSVLIIGFGRFGQIASQMLQARAVPITALDNDPKRIDDAGIFGFKVYYGDGTRLDVLRAAGADRAKLILVCLRDAERSMHVIERLKDAYPDTPIYARSYDRRHTLQLMEAEVDYQIRDTYESALALGRESLHGLGLSRDEAMETEEVVRRADQQRLDAQAAGGIYAGKDIFVRPEPLTTPKRESEIHRLAQDGRETGPGDPTSLPPAAREETQAAE